MQKTAFLFLGLFPLLFHCLRQPVSAQSKHSAEASIGRTTNLLSNSEMGLLNINDITVWVRRDGWSGRNPVTGNSGTAYPRGTANVVFQDGMVWGGIVHDTRMPSWPQKRVGGCTYLVGTIPGWIMTPGTPTTPPVAVDRNHPRARIYKIRRDWQTISASDADIIMEAAEFNNILVGQVTPQMIQAIIDRYALDWTEWPGDLGAPFYDLNANGLWDPGIDKPGLQNADQVLWFVINDADSIVTKALYGAPPIGLEVQTTLWGYKADGVFGQAVYRRTRIINKSGFLIDSVYVSQWSDPDIGDSGDDFAGCDTVLNAAFVYNSRANDFVYEQYGLRPPAAGYVLMQGPIVRTGNLQDTALFDFRRIPGARNRRMTASTYAAAGSPIVVEPVFGSYEGTLQWFNFFRGRLLSGSSFVHPLVPGVTTFWLDGDPLTSTGRLDGAISGPGDRRFSLSTGEFTMTNGDTQEVVIALVGGIRHTGNHLTSLAEMKENIAQLRLFYGRQFDVPDVSRWTIHPTDTTTQLYVRADLTTQNNATSSYIIFTPEAGPERRFVLQLYDDGLHNDSLAGDGIWGNSVIRRNHKYPVSGDLVVQAAGGVQTFAGLYGNVPLRPMPVFSNLRVVWENGRQDSLLNHRETIHAAFDLVNPDGLNSIDTVRITNLGAGVMEQVIIYTTSIPPRGTVSDPSFFLIINGPDSGSVHRFSYRVRSDFASAINTASLPVVTWNPGSHWGDTLAVSSIRGPAYNVKPVIADASLLTGHTYLMTFFQGTSDVRWRLLDRTTGQLKYNNGVITPSPGYPHPVIDGVQYRVMVSNPDVADFLVVANSAGPLVPPEGAAATFGGFPVFADPTERQQVGPAEWLIHTGAGALAGDYYYPRFVSRVFRNDNFSRFVPYDFELRFTAAGGRAYLAFQSGAVINVPFELWNVGVGTPTNPADDYRMIPLLNDPNNNRVFDLDGIDHPISGGNDDPETDWIYWFEPLDRSPGSGGYIEWAAAPDPDIFLGDEVMARVVLVNWDGGTPPGPYNQLRPEQGTVFRIISKKTNIAGDSLLVVATPTSVPIDGIPASVHLDQNYPNPFNPITTIRFGLPLRGRVELNIYNILGQKVRTMFNGEMERGEHVVQWDSRNDAGRSVASGVYFYRLTIGEFVQTRKMLLLR